MEEAVNLRSRAEAFLQNQDSAAQNLQLLSYSVEKLAREVLAAIRAVQQQWEETVETRSNALAKLEELVEILNSLPYLHTLNGALTVHNPNDRPAPIETYLLALPNVQDQPTDIRLRDYGFGANEALELLLPAGRSWDLISDVSITPPSHIGVELSTAELGTAGTEPDAGHLGKYLGGGTELMDDYLAWTRRMERTHLFSIDRPSYGDSRGTWAWIVNVRQIGNAIEVTGPSQSVPPLDAWFAALVGYSRAGTIETQWFGVHLQRVTRVDDLFREIVRAQTRAG